MEYTDFIASLPDYTRAVSPILLLLAVGLFLMLLDAFKVREVLPWVAGLGLVGSAILAVMARPEGSHVVFGMLETGWIAPLIHAFLCLAGIFALVFIPDYLKRMEKPVYETYALLVFAILGMVLLANATDLVMTFIGLETMSVALYIFAGLFKTDKGSNEAGLKYFLLGAFASGFLLFGIALIYGIAGTTNLDELAALPELIQQNLPLFYTGVGLILVGFLFKIAAFPFHNWTPDVYEGAPTPLAGFMATGSKMAAFVALSIFLVKIDFTGYEKIVAVLALSALLTMIYGNYVAARQNNVKRMLAYSSIAHTGYVLLAVCAGREGLIAVIFYMFIYTIMNIGAFGLVGMAERDHADTNLDHWRGLGMKSPYFAAAMSVFLFSLAGIPPLAGFMGKYYIFISAIRADLIILSTIGILTTVVGAFYYIRVIVKMYFGKEDTPDLNISFGTVPMIGTLVLVLLILLFGIFPSLIINPIESYFGLADSYSAASILP